MRKRILMVFGTRPEAIKMAPIYKKLIENKDKFHTTVCLSGQHREMLDQVMDLFKIKADIDLNLMGTNQDLHDITANILLEMKSVFKTYEPDLVMVHGDTTTALASALACFYSGIKVCHVEAGLRTFNLQAPYPEEFNRQVISKICNFHLAPTSEAKQNLLDEGIKEKNILVSGNTVIDALFLTLENLSDNSLEEKELFPN